MIKKNKHLIETITFNYGHKLINTFKNLAFQPFHFIMVAMLRLRPFFWQANHEKRIIVLLSATYQYTASLAQPLLLQQVVSCHTHDDPKKQ